MFQRFLMHPWASTRSISPGTKLEGNFVLHQNKRYRAKITLTWVESFVGNDYLAQQFVDLGFKEPVVQGTGSVRVGQALWPAADRSIGLPLDPHLSDVVELA